VSIVTSEATVAEGELKSLYGRYKALAISASAAVILEAPLDGVAVGAEQLLADCRAAARAGGPHAAQLAVCASAASSLYDLVVRAGGHEVLEAELDRARASHRELRREVWNVVPCEYVPCCADDHHIHRS